jgi:hypothetical protein
MTIVTEECPELNAKTRIIVYFILFLTASFAAICAPCKQLR